MIEQLGERIERAEDTLQGYTDRLTAAGLQISDRMSAIERAHSEIRREASEAKEIADRVERSRSRERTAEIQGRWQLWAALVSGLSALLAASGVALVQIVG